MFNLETHDGNETNISYRIAGDGPPLLLLHGFPVQRNAQHSTGSFPRCNLNISLNSTAFGHNATPSTPQPSGTTLHPVDDANEGGELKVRGSDAFQHWVVDSYQGNFRIFESADSVRDGRTHGEVHQEPALCCCNRWICHKHGKKRGNADTAKLCDRGVEHELPGSL